MKYSFTPGALKTLVFAVLAYSAITISGCNKADDLPPIDLKYNYFPVDSGHWVIYQVDSITFDNFFVPVKVETVSFQLKEIITEKFIDNEGRPTCRVERYRRDSDTSAWRIWNVWMANRTTTTAERVEDNLRFIKLVFPLDEGKQWLGNIHINATGNISWLADWEYTLTEMDVPAQIGDLYFDSTLTVLQTDQENLIEKRYSIEKYARNVGLIYKELQKLEKSNVTDPWTKPESGFILRMEIIDYKR